MNLFEMLGQLGHEQVVFFHHRESGLRCVIAIHSTLLGPALGGLAHVALCERSRCRSRRAAAIRRT